MEAGAAVLVCPEESDGAERRGQHQRRLEAAVEAVQHLSKEGQRAMGDLSGDTRNNAIDIWTGIIKRPETYDYRTTDAWHDRYKELGGYEALKNIALHPFFDALRTVPSAKRKYTRALKEMRKALRYTG